MAVSHTVVLYESTETSPEVTTAAGFLAGYSGRTREAYTLSLQLIQQTSDEERRPFRRELRYQRHDRSGRLGVQRDVPDDSLIAHGHPRPHRLRPGEEPREVPVGKEDGVALRRVNANSDGDELVEVVVAASSEAHDS